MSSIYREDVIDKEGGVEKEIMEMEEDVQTSDKPSKTMGKHQKKGFRLPAWLFTTLVSILMSALSIFVYDRFFTQKVVSLDIKGYIAEQRDLYLSGKINDEQFRANIDKLEAKVKSVPKNRVVIMGDAVVKNAEVIKP